MFYYSKKLLKSVLDFYFYGGFTDKSQYLMRIIKHSGSGEELIILVADITRAVGILDIEEKLIVAYRHSGFIFDEICGRIGMRKQNVINYYDSGIIKMMFYLNGNQE